MAEDERLLNEVKGIKTVLYDLQREVQQVNSQVVGLANKGRYPCSRSLLLSPPEHTPEANSHRAALVSIATPVVLLWLFGIKPSDMPILSLAVGANNLIPFWKVMTVLVSWAWLVFFIDLVVLLIERLRLKADMNQNLAYDVTYYVDHPNPDDEYGAGPDDSDDYRAQTNLRNRYSNWKSWILNKLHWITRILFPFGFGSIALVICFVRVYQVTHPVIKVLS